MQQVCQACYGGAELLREQFVEGAFIRFVSRQDSSESLSFLQSSCLTRSGARQPMRLLLKNQGAITSCWARITCAGGRRKKTCFKGTRRFQPVHWVPCLLCDDLLTTVPQVLVSIDLATRLPFYPRIDYFVDHDLLPDSPQLHFRFVFRDALSSWINTYEACGKPFYPGIWGPMSWLKQRNLL